MDRIQDLLFVWRRPIAAALTFVAVLAVVAALQPQESGVRVVSAARDLDSGAVLGPDDLAVRVVPASVVPTHAVIDVEQAEGARLGGPVRAGELLTDRRLLDPRSVGGQIDGDAVLSTVRLADTTSLDGLQVGDLVDVVAVDPHGSDEPSVVAPAARVAALPTRSEEDRAAQPTVTLAVSDDVALGLASASLSNALTLLTHTSG